MLWCDLQYLLVLYSISNVIPILEICVYNIAFLTKMETEFFFCVLEVADMSPSDKMFSARVH